MKITTLLENTSARPELSAEHGLSLYIETAEHRILFDMGQTALFSHNASVLGIDLAAVDIDTFDYVAEPDIDTSNGALTRIKFYISENQLKVAWTSFEPVGNGHWE